MTSINNYFDEKLDDFETLTFSILWVGNHIGEAAGGMTVTERMSALNASNEILANTADTSDKDLFVLALMVVGGENAQSLLDTYNADSRSTEQGLKDTARILTEYAESGQSGAVEQSTFFMNALVKMAQAVIDESDESSSDMKARNKAFDFITELMSANPKPNKSGRKAAENSTSNAFKNQSVGVKTITQKIRKKTTDKIKSKTKSGNYGCSGCAIFVAIVVFILYLLFTSFFDELFVEKPNEPTVQELQQPYKPTQREDFQSANNISFEQAFKNARMKNQEVFMWKGKPYTTELKK
jgi:hypothetical protein